MLQRKAGAAGSRAFCSLWALLSSTPLGAVWRRKTHLQDGSGDQTGGSQAPQNRGLGVLPGLLPGCFHLSNRAKGRRSFRCHVTASRAPRCVCGESCDQVRYNQDSGSAAIHTHTGAATLLPSQGPIWNTPAPCTEATRKHCSPTKPPLATPCAPENCTSWGSLLMPLGRFGQWEAVKEKRKQEGRSQGILPYPLDSVSGPCCVSSGGSVTSRKPCLCGPWVPHDPGWPGLWPLTKLLSSSFSPTRGEKGSRGCSHLNAEWLPHVVSQLLSPVINSLYSIPSVRKTQSSFCFPGRSLTDILPMTIY